MLPDAPFISISKTKSHCLTLINIWLMVYEVPDFHRLHPRSPVVLPAQVPGYFRAAGILKVSVITVAEERNEMPRGMRFLVAVLAVAYAMTFIPLLRRSDGVSDFVPLAVTILVLFGGALWLVLSKKPLDK